MIKPPSEAFRAEAFRLGLVLCLISVPFGLVLALVAPMAGDTGDIENPAIIAFVFLALIYPLVALMGGAVALLKRRRLKAARPWACLMVPVVNIAAILIAAMAI
jgi:hypothetical protein